MYELEIVINITTSQAIRGLVNSIARSVIRTLILVENPVAQ